MPEATFKIQKWRQFALLPLPILTAINTWGFADRHWPMSSGQTVFVWGAVLLILFLASYSIWLLYVGRNFISLSDKGMKYYKDYNFKPSFIEWSQLISVNPPQRFFGVIEVSYTGKDGAVKTSKILAGLLGKENAASLSYLISESASSQSKLQPA